MRRVAFTPDEQLSGYRTLVTDKSRDGLPTDIDREKQTVLPPGSATPNSPRKEDEPASNGRHLSSPSYNGPGTGEPGPAEHPRTLPTPGGEPPTKFDYNMPTRRTMTAEEKLGYRPRIPWRRQKRQRVFKKLKDHRYYQRNKASIRQRLKLWYKSVKHNQNFRSRKEDRRDNPPRYKRKKVGDVEISCCGTVAKEAYTPWSLGKRRHRVRGPAHHQRHRQYIRNRARAHRQHHLWYQKNRHKPAFKRRQRLRRQHPNRFRLRPASLRVAGYVPGEIWFVYGPQATLAVIEAVGPDIVTFTDAHTEDVHELTPQALMQVASFLSEEDLHAMMEALDEHGGEDPYGDTTLRDLLDVAALFGVSCADILLGDTPVEEGVVALTEEAMAGWHVEPASIDRVATLYLRAVGELLRYDQRSPEDGRWEKPESFPSGSPVGPGQWTKADPADPEAPTPGGLPHVDVPDSGGSGKVVPEHLKYAVTIRDIEGRTAEDVRRRSRETKVRLSRADPQRGIWTFRANGSEGRAYTIRVQAAPAGNTKAVDKLQVRVSCDCDFFRWQGPEHHAKANDYLYGKPRGTASAPKTKDPKREHWACKHVVAALALARGYRVASVDAWWPGDADISPHYGVLASRVAERYGGGE